MKPENKHEGEDFIFSLTTSRVLAQRTFPYLYYDMKNLQNRDFELCARKTSISRSKQAVEAINDQA